MQDTLDLAIELNTEHSNFIHAKLCQDLLYIMRQKNKWDLPSSFEEYAFSYECKPLPTKFCTSAEVLDFRDKAFIKYFSNDIYLDSIEKSSALKIGIIF